MKNSNKILFIIFFATVIPTVYIYLEHGFEELGAGEKSLDAGNNHKYIKQSGEGFFFILIANGYIWTTGFLLWFSKSKIPYLVLIIGTIAVVILYFLRIFGIPIPFTDVIIRDLSTDWRDVATKIPQMIMLVPLSILLERRKNL